MSKASLIIGGSGALGKSMVRAFANQGWKTVNLDINANSEADGNIALNPSADIGSQRALMLDQTKSFTN